MLDYVLTVRVLSIVHFCREQASKFSADTEMEAGGPGMRSPLPI